MQTYGLSKLGKGSTDEADFLLCRAGKFILFSSLFCKVLEEKTWSNFYGLAP